MTRTFGRSDSASVVTTSWNSGSPTAPGSFVRSSTAIELTVAGSAASRASVGNGRNKRIVASPTFSPSATSFATVSPTAPEPEPIITMTRSASGAPS